MAALIIARAQALEAGLTRYFTGKPCKHGHLCERITDNGTCVTCHYARGKTTYSKTRERKIQHMREYRRDNWEKVKGIQYAWQAKNPGYGALRQANRRKQAAVASVFAGDELNDLVFAEAFALAEIRRAVTGVSWHVDHMVPLRAKNACGLHCWTNIQVIPSRLNNVKHNRMMLTEPLEWLAAM